MFGPRSLNYFRVQAFNNVGVLDDNVKKVNDFFFLSVSNNLILTGILCVCIYVANARGGELVPLLFSNHLSC